MQPAQASVHGNAVQLQTDHRVLSKAGAYLGCPCARPPLEVNIFCTNI